MRAILLTLVYLILILPQAALAQKKPAVLSGKVVDENENPLARVSVTVLGKRDGVSTSDSGTFTLQVPSDKAFALVFSFTGYKTVQRNFLLSENESEYVVVRMDRGTGHAGLCSGNRSAATPRSRP